jgi:hypothetical protein
MTKAELSRYFNINHSNIGRGLVAGIPYYEFHDILENDSLTRREKKNLIYGFKDVTRTIKDSIWERFIGDKGFNYSKGSIYMVGFKKIQKEFHEEALCAMKH